MFLDSSHVDNGWSIRFGNTCFYKFFAKCINPPEISSLIQLNEFALGSVVGECQLYSEEYNHQNGMVDCFNKPRVGTVIRESILSRTLDSLVDTFMDDEYIGVMKIDIEGYEFYLFQGA